VDAEGQAAAAAESEGAARDRVADPAVVEAAVSGAEEVPCGPPRVLVPRRSSPRDLIRSLRQAHPRENLRFAEFLHARDQDCLPHQRPCPQILRQWSYLLPRFSPVPQHPRGALRDWGPVFGRTRPAALEGGGVDGGSGVPVSSAMPAALPVLLRSLVERMVCRLSCSSAKVSLPSLEKQCQIQPFDRCAQRAACEMRCIS
jgi:hypothetical protein